MKPWPPTPDDRLTAREAVGAFLGGLLGMAVVYVALVLWLSLPA